METKTPPSSSLPPPLPGSPSASSQSALGPNGGSADGLLVQFGSDKHRFKSYGSLPPGPGKRPRGRPSKNVNPFKSDSTDEPPGRPTVAVDAESETVDRLPSLPPDPSLLRASVESVIGTIECFTVPAISKRAVQLYEPGDAKLLAEKGGRCPAHAKECLEKGTAACVAKYGFNSEYMPEMTLAAGFAAWGAGFRMMLSEMDAKLAEKAEKEKPTPKADATAT